MKQFKFFQKDHNQTITNFLDNVDIFIPNVERRHSHIAIVAASQEDFILYQREMFGYTRILNMGREFVVGSNRYTSITHPDQLRGMMFDNFIITPMAQQESEPGNHINQIIGDIQLCIRRMERRTFTIPVGEINPEEVDSFIQNIRNTFR